MLALFGLTLECGTKSVRLCNEAGVLHDIRRRLFKAVPMYVTNRVSQNVKRWLGIVFTSRPSLGRKSS